MSEKPIEQRSHKKWLGRSLHGRSTCDIECPFCGAVITAYIWSLAGCGKKCGCGAIHSSFNQSSKEAE